MNMVFRILGYQDAPPDSSVAHISLLIALIV
jgi:hypothetical protein